MSNFVGAGRPLCGPPGINEAAPAMVAPVASGLGARTADAAFRVLYFSGADGKLHEAFWSRESVARNLDTVLSCGGLIVGVYLCD